MGRNNRILFLFSKGISYTGTKLFTFALSWYILTQTGSGLRFSASLLVNYLPQIVLSLFIGRFTDKLLRPNRVLVLCDAASAAVCCLPLLHTSLASIYTTIFLLSAISAVFNNVIDTHLIRLEGVDAPETLKKLTSALQFITYGINIAAPSIGGALIHVLTVRWFAVINIVSFLLSALGEVWLRYKSRRLDAGVSGDGGRAVLSYMFGQRKLRIFFLADSIGNFCVSAGISVALPLVVTTALGISSGGYGLIASSLAAGSTVCAVWRMKFPGSSRMEYPFLKLGEIGGCMLLLGLAAWLPNYGVWTEAALCADMFWAGWLSVDINIQVKTALQLYIDPACLGRVLGISTSISYVLIPLSLVIAGAMSEAWPAFILPLSSGSVLIAALSFLSLLDRRADQTGSIRR